MKPPFVVSRCDRLGDLILSLPVLGYLKDAGIEHRILHVSRYAADVGEWARYNGLCEDLWIEDDPVPTSLREAVAREPRDPVGLSLFHSSITVKAFREARLRRTLGARTKLSAMLQYQRSVPQHRSRVAMSEARYNIQLARACLKWIKIPSPEFRGLPALKVPPEWMAPRAEERRAPADIIIVVSNNGSAANWPLPKYIELANERLKAGQTVDFLVSGIDAKEREELLRRSGVLNVGARLVPPFRMVRELIAYLAAAKEVISSSTGPLHLAHAAGVPVFGIYPDKPKQQTFARWRPDGYAHESPVRYVSFSPEGERS